MSPRRARRKLAPDTRKKSGSSRRPKLQRGAEESRRFGAFVPAPVAVEGRVKGWRLPKAALRGLLKAYLKALGLPRAGVSLRLLDDDASRELNRRFRGLDEPTDVLSFPLETKVLPGFAGMLGDLALNLPYAWRRRGRFHPRFEGEAAFLLLHGLLHLCGRHHDSPAQERALWREQDAHFPPEAALLRALRTLRPQA